MDFNLKTVGSFTTTDDFVYPFALESIGNVLIQRCKNSFEIVRLKKEYFNRESKVQLTSIKTEKPTDVIQLPVSEKEVIWSADWNEKNQLTMNAFLLPNCTLKNIHYIKTRIIENTGNELMLAALTNAGIIELYRYNLKGHKIDKIPIDLNELQKETECNKKIIKKYEVLKDIYNKVSFSNIDWCPEKFDNFKLLAAVTKFDEILIFSIHEDKAELQLKIKLEGASNNEIRWTFNHQHGHNLFVGTDKGNLIRFPLKIQNDGKIKCFNNDNEEIFGKLKIAPNYIYVNYFSNEIIIFCCKNHSIEIIHKNGLKFNVITKHVGLSITGFTNVGQHEYIMTTLNGNAVYMRLSYNEKHLIEIQNYQKIEILLPSDEFNDSIQENSKLGYYGVATSKNKVLVYISAYPRNYTDHLVVKQMAHLYVNLWSGTDPFEVLKNNPSLCLTEYADCVEAVRIQGVVNSSIVETLETMPYEIELDETFLYYLKVQLMLINTKIFYYSTRSQDILDIYKKSRSYMHELIKVMKIYMNLEKMLELMGSQNPGDISEIKIMALRAMKKFLIGYCRKSITVAPYYEASDKFKPMLEKLVEKCQTIKIQAASEQCIFCEEDIADEEETCNKEHQMKRCVITNLLVELDSRDCCPECLVSVTSSENLKALFNDSKDSSICPFCDALLFFYE